MSDLPDVNSLERAVGRLVGVAVRTPVVRSDLLDAKVGARVFLKAETLQKTGSFKIRGAYNKLSALGTDAQAHGVVAWSSGNHAQGVAAAAAMLDVRATIVMPADAPSVKMARTRAWGARIVPYDRLTEDREAIAYRIAEKSGAAIVPSYDDPEIIAGQGTAGLELVEQLREQGVALEALLVPCSGGGLLAGMALAFAQGSPMTRMFAVEPEGRDDHRRSFAGDKISEVPADALATSGFCDALLAPRPGNLTFTINHKAGAQGLTVSDDEVRAAMRFAFEELKLVVEPGGAVALAALMAHGAPEGAHAVGAVLSGGNVDAALYRSVLMSGAPR